MSRGDNNNVRLPRYSPTVKYVGHVLLGNPHSAEQDVFVPLLYSIHDEYYYCAPEKSARMTEVRPAVVGTLWL